MKYIENGIIMTAIILGFMQSKSWKTPLDENWYTLKHVHGNETSFFSSTTAFFPIDNYNPTFEKYPSGLIHAIVTMCCCHAVEWLAKICLGALSMGFKLLYFFVKTAICGVVQVTLYIFNVWWNVMTFIFKQFITKCSPLLEFALQHYGRARRKFFQVVKSAWKALLVKIRTNPVIAEKPLVIQKLPDVCPELSPNLECLDVIVIPNKSEVLPVSKVLGPDDHFDFDDNTKICDDVNFDPNFEKNTFPIFCTITKELHSKITECPDTHVAIFNISNTQSKENDNIMHNFNKYNVVRLPNLDRWNLISKTLLELKHFIISSQSVDRNLGELLSSTVHSYREVDSWGPPDFGILERDSLQEILRTVVPQIIDFALALPRLLSRDIPILGRGESKAIFVSKQLACSLLANGFLCTLPKEDEDMPDFNFFRLFEEEEQVKKSELKMEKVKCILNYFATMTERVDLNFEDQNNTLISYERRCISTTQKWRSSKSKLISVTVEPLTGIEEVRNCLQVDFANKVVGGSVLGTGAVMEEIRFSICPELILSRLFTEPLDDDEVLLITGSEQFSNYNGYGSTFKFGGSHQNSKVDVDDFGRRKTQVVAMDALYFGKDDFDAQFERENIDRELHKSFVAFSNTPDDSESIPVATGNWGCGVFNGSPELKFFIQWMAASQAGRPGLQYHTIGNVEQSQSIESIVKKLLRSEADVSMLYKFLLKYYDEKENWESLFKFVNNSLRKRKKKDSGTFIRVKNL